MIASSTSAPMAMAMPPSVIVLIVAPNARSTSTAAASDSGIAVSVIAAARRLARNSSTIDDDEQAAVAQRGDDVVDRHLDEVGLTEDPAVDRHACRQLLLKRVELAIEPRRQFDRVGARLLLDADDDGGLAVARSFAALERRAFADVGDVADRAPSDHRAARRRSRRFPRACARDRSSAARTPADPPCRCPADVFWLAPRTASSSSLSEMLLARS